MARADERREREMKRIEEQNPWRDFELSTGKKFYANRGILGLSEDGDITEGYDGGFDERKFNKAERKEIAEYMINLWKKWGGI